MNYAHTITVSLPYEEAVTKVRQELANQGFGVLTEIDVHATFEAKLGSESAQPGIGRSAPHGLAVSA